MATEEIDETEQEVQTTLPPAAPRKLLNLTIRELPLKQAPMEAVIRRET
jgi:hypothetical protein